MPYGVFEFEDREKPFCVYKVNEEKERIGESLGCHSSKEDASDQIFAIEANEKKVTLVHTDFTKLYAKKTNDGLWRLEVLGVPFGGHKEGKDSQGEYFSPKTNIHLNIGDERPVFYYHGENPLGMPDRDPDEIGTAKYIRKDDKGHWFEVLLDQTKKYADRIWRAAINGIAYASSGAINYLVRKRPDGELYKWPIGELTLVDGQQGVRMPANMLATVAIKTVFKDAESGLPETFVKTEQVKTSVVQEEERVEQNNELYKAVISTVVAYKKGE